MDTNCSSGTSQISPEEIPRKRYRSNSGRLAFDVCLNKERCNEETEESSQEDIIHTKRKSRQVIYDTEESSSDSECDRTQESNSDLSDGCNRMQETCCEYSSNTKEENTCMKSSEEDIIPIKYKRVNVTHDTESDDEEQFDKMKQTGLRMNIYDTGEKYVGEKTVSLESELSNTVTTDNNACAAENKIKTEQNTKETTDEINSSQEDEKMFVRRKRCRRLTITDSESSSLDKEDITTTAFDGNDNVDFDDDGVEEHNENQENSEENSQESLFEDDFLTDGGSSQENLQRAEVRELLSQNGVPVYLGFEAHFHRVVQALITDAVKGNFLAQVLYGRGNKDKSAKEMLASLDYLDKCVEPQLCALRPGYSWQTQYTNYLDAYSCLDFNEQGAIEMKCQACSKNRMCKYKITLSGSDYDKKTLKRDIFLDDERVVQVGCLCAEKTRLYHQLRHFKYNLHQDCISVVQHYPANNEADDRIKHILAQLDKGWIQEQRNQLSDLIENAANFWEKAQKMIEEMRSVWG